MALLGWFGKWFGWNSTGPAAATAKGTSKTLKDDSSSSKLAPPPPPAPPAAEAEAGLGKEVPTRNAPGQENAAKENAAKEANEDILGQQAKKVVGQQENATPAAAGELTPELPTNQRFMVQRGQVVGVENTIRRYQEHRPIKLHGTPFEERVDHVMQEEMEVVPLQPLNLNK